MRSAIALALVVVLAATASSSAQFFSETFDDGAGATRWSAPVVDSEAAVFDGTVDFAFDYGAIGIPAAPGGGNTIGLFMESNLTDNGNDQGESIGMTSLLASLPDTYVLTMDVYFNVDNNAGGTTEYAYLGVHASGANFPADLAVNDDIPFDFNLSDGDGLAWMADGDGGASNDIHRFEDPGNLDAGSQTGLGSYDDIPDGSIPGVPTGANNFPKFGPEELWVTMTVKKSGDFITWSMNGYELDSVDNSDNRYSGGTILVGYGDPFNSVANISAGTDAYPNFAHFAIFDNITLTVPEPGTVALFAMGALVFLAQRGAGRRFASGKSR
jgi:hypothetical protein